MGFAPPPHGDIGELLWFDDRADSSKCSSFSGSPLRPRMDGTSILRSPIVTGLEKLSRLQQRPLSHFYSAMARDAMRADVIYVIGSGLADLHLNTWLGEARARTPKPPLLVVDLWPHGFEDDTYFELDSQDNPTVPSAPGSRHRINSRNARRKLDHVARPDRGDMGQGLSGLPERPGRARDRARSPAIRALTWSGVFER